MSEKMSIWMPEFVRSTNHSTMRLIEEGMMLNRLAEILEAKNRERQESGGLG